MSYFGLKKDTTTNAATTIDYAHHEIHGGSFYTYHDVITLNDTIAQDYWFVTPNTTKWAHIGHMVESNAPITLDLYEATTHTTDSASAAPVVQTCYNRNRNVLTANTTVIKKNTALGKSIGGSDGTRIIWYAGGVSTNKVTNGTTAGTANEKVLKQNTSYIFRITSGADSNKIALSFDWYEHTNT